MQGVGCAVCTCATEVLKVLEEKRKKTNKKNVNQRRKYIESLCLHYLTQFGYSIQLKETDVFKTNEFRVIEVKNGKGEIVFNRKTLKEQAIVNGLEGVEKRKFVELNYIRKLVRLLEIHGVFITFYSLRTSTDIAKMSFDDEIEQQISTIGKQCFYKIKEMVENGFYIISPNSL